MNTKTLYHFGSRRERILVRYCECCGTNHSTGTIDCPRCGKHLETIWSTKRIIRAYDLDPNDKLPASPNVWVVRYD